MAILICIGNSRDRNFLFINDAQGRLASAATNYQAVAADQGSSEGTSWVDYDNDGDLDLYITTRGRIPNLLYRNDQAGGLTKIPTHMLAVDSMSATMACWADIEGDGDLDVLVVGYRHNGNRVYENLGDGSFRERADHLLWGGEGTGRNCSCGNANNDGLPEFFIAHARKPNEYYRNEGNWNFSRLEQGLLIEDLGYGYGSSWADIEDDGDLDLFLTNFDKENFLFINDGAGNFTPRAEGALLGPQGGASKGQSWGDYDNDGDIDLYVGNGTHAADMQNFFYLNEGNGSFTKVTSPSFLQHSDTSAAVAHADFDRDGDLDLIIVNWGYQDPNRFLINRTTSRNWISFRLKGLASNSHGIGTRIELVTGGQDAATRQFRWMYPITGYSGQNDYELHFGLLNSTAIDHVVVYWPSGQIDRYPSPSINSHHLLTEGGSIEQIR